MVPSIDVAMANGEAKNHSARRVDFRQSGFCFPGDLMSDSDDLKSGIIYSLTRPVGGEISEDFKPYAAELGALVYVWNGLQENLAELFWAITEIQNGSIPLGIWHSTQNDRAQRSMLRAATEARFNSTINKYRNEQAYKEITWLLSETDKLAERRNNSIHSPFWFIISPGPVQMVPNDFQQNPRARKLKGKNLLNEFKLNRDTAALLSGFALRLSSCVRSASITWPERLSLPNRGQKKTRALSKEDKGDESLV
jgi:hypothetical protein